MPFAKQNDLGIWIPYGTLPARYNTGTGWIENFPEVDEATHKANGFYTLIAPPINEDQTYGIITFDPGTETCTYTVEDLPIEVIQNRILEEADEQQELIAEEFVIIQAQDEAQQLPDEDAKHKANIYPFWIPDFSYTLNFKAQYLDSTDLKLFKCVQPHTSQDGWQPPNVPALWTQIPLDGQILPWKQPTGAQDAYNTGDIVSYQGQNWESTVDANVFAPGVVQAQWIIYTPPTT